MRNRGEATPRTASAPAVVIPVRSFVSGKQRLAGALSGSARRRLTRLLAERAVAAAWAAGAGRVIVVTGRDEVRDWAEAGGLEVVPDPGAGLDTAVAAATTTLAAGVPRLVVHADLPLVTGSALEPMLIGAGAGPVIAPSHDGGTTVLGGRESPRFGYGAASFHRHLARLPGARIFVDYRLALDLDRRRDLETVARLPGGSWLRPLLG